MGNTIENSRMGSYFVEGSVRVIGNANLIRNSGSRAVTIERGSHENTFCNNVILNSYREGLWLMGCSECLIQGNRFENNGWRNSEGLDSTIKIEWLKSFANDKANSNLITHNIIKMQPQQDQAIWIASGENSRGNIIADNLIIGSKLSVRDEGSETVVERNRLRSPNAGE
jgi:parallel beta-helix repeat protein